MYLSMYKEWLAGCLPASFCLSVCLFVSLSVCLSPCLPVSVSLFVSVHPSTGSGIAPSSNVLTRWGLRKNKCHLSEHVSQQNVCCMKTARHGTDTHGQRVEPVWTICCSIVGQAINRSPCLDEIWCPRRHDVAMLAHEKIYTESDQIMALDLIIAPVQHWWCCCT